MRKIIIIGVFLLFIASAFGQNSNTYCYEYTYYFGDSEKIRRQYVSDTCVINESTIDSSQYIIEILHFDTRKVDYLISFKYPKNLKNTTDSIICATKNTYSFKEIRAISRKQIDEISYIKVSDKPISHKKRVKKLLRKSPKLSFKTTFTDETKSVMGYPCRKAIIVVNKKTEHIVWFAEINKSLQNNMYLFTIYVKIPGVVFEESIDGKPFRCIAGIQSGKWPEYAVPVSN